MPNPRPPPLPAATLAGHATVRHFVGRIDGHDCWALKLERPRRLARSALRAAMLQFPGALMGAASRAAQVLEWDRAHRFCGVCGTPTERRPTSTRASARPAATAPTRG